MCLDERGEMHLGNPLSSFSFRFLTQFTIPLLLPAFRLGKKGFSLNCPIIYLLSIGALCPSEPTPGDGICSYLPIMSTPFA
jgi:hypothetical protein